MFILWAQGFKVWSIFWSWCSGKILKLKFGHCFAVDASYDYEVQDRFGQEFEVEVQAKLLKLKFGQYFAAEAWWGYEVKVWSKDIEFGIWLRFV